MSAEARRQARLDAELLLHDDEEEAGADTDCGERTSGASIVVDAASPAADAWRLYLNCVSSRVASIARAAVDLTCGVREAASSLPRAAPPTAAAAAAAAATLSVILDGDAEMGPGDDGGVAGAPLHHDDGGDSQRGDESPYAVGGDSSDGWAYVGIGATAPLPTGREFAAAVIPRTSPALSSRCGSAIPGTPLRLEVAGDAMPAICTCAAMASPHELVVDAEAGELAALEARLAVLASQSRDAERLRVDAAAARVEQGRQRRAACSVLALQACWRGRRGRRELAGQRQQRLARAAAAAAAVAAAAALACELRGALAMRLAAAAAHGAVDELRRDAAATVDCDRRRMLQEDARSGDANGQWRDERAAAEETRALALQDVASRAAARTLASAAAASLLYRFDAPNVRSSEQRARRAVRGVAALWRAWAGRRRAEEEAQRQLAVAAANAARSAAAAAAQACSRVQACWRRHHVRRLLLAAVGSARRRCAGVDAGSFYDLDCDATAWLEGVGSFLSTAAAGAAATRSLLLPGRAPASGRTPLPAAVATATTGTQRPNVEATSSGAAYVAAGPPAPPRFIESSPAAAAIRPVGAVIAVASPPSSGGSSSTTTPAVPGNERGAPRGCSDGESVVAAVQAKHEGAGGPADGAVSQSAQQTAQLEPAAQRESSRWGLTDPATLRLMALRAARMRGGDHRDFRRAPPRGQPNK